jgi:hypothetical protein
VTLATIVVRAARALTDANREEHRHECGNRDIPLANDQLAIPVWGAAGKSKVELEYRDALQSPPP